VKALLVKHLRENLFKIVPKKVGIEIALRVDIVVGNVWGELDITRHFLE